MISLHHQLLNTKERTFNLDIFCVQMSLGIEKYTLKKQRLKITQLEKARFIKVNELKFTQVELFSFFHFVYAAANASKLICMIHLGNIERFLPHSNFSF